MRTAIVTTLIDGEKIVDSFVNYHLRIGFDHIYLFFDDPSDSAIKLVRDRPAVTTIISDLFLMSKWTETRAYKRYAHFRDRIQAEPMARQILNAEIALEMAKKDDIDWILHIDIDELFYCPNQSVGRHFAHLENRGLFCQRYLNYEGIPEYESIDDYFLEVTLFKKNPRFFSVRQFANFRKYINKKLFNYYKIGKMAARVDAVLIPGIHDFIFREPYADKESAKHDVNLVSSNPIILHYPCCGFDFFWQKFKRLGDFDPDSFGREQYETYRQSKGLIASNDEALARRYYHANIMYSEIEIDMLLELGLAERINEPSKMLLEKS